MSAFSVDPENEKYLTNNDDLVDKENNTLLFVVYMKSGNYVIPNGVETVEQNAFEGRKLLEHVSIPGSVTSLGDKPFAYCSSLTAIDVDPSNTFYASDNGILFSHNNLTLIRFPPGKSRSDYTIPDDVSELADDAFEGCKYLVNITLSSNVGSVGTRPFRGCSSFTLYRC